jgi:hypothetical protein
MAAVRTNENEGEYSSPADKAAAQAAQKESTQQTQQQGLQSYANIAIGDLNSGNYAGALQAGLDSGELYNTNYGSTTTDPLLQALESSQGLQELDPTKKWDASSIQQYYSAFGANSVTTGTQAGTADAGESWGKNPYGTWGDPTKIAADAQTNISTQGDNSAPDLQRFVGARPTTSFLGKYGADIAALAATALSFGVAAPALAGALAADGIASGLAAGAIAGGVMGGVNTLAVDAITGKPITAGGFLGGALSGAAGGGLTGLAGGAINDATGLGSTVSTGLAGAGIGAGKAALTGGNVGLGALTGGIGGAVQGSGIAGNIKGSLTGAGVPSGLAGAVTNGGINYAVGGATGLAAGALMGNQSGAQPSGSVLSQGAQGSNGQVATTSANSSLGNLGASVTSNSIYNGGALAPSNNNSPGSANYVAPGSTDQSLASTIGGAVPGLLSTAAGVYGQQNAAQAQQNADQNAITTQQNNLGNINNIWASQQQTGQGANAALQSSLGLNGQTADPSNFENMPGYQFAVQQGTQAIQRQAASMGNAYTPNTAEAVGQYVTGTAAQDYNTYISQLMGAAGLGTTASQGLQTGSQTSSNNISQLQQNIGQAQASGVTGAANTIAGAFGANGVGTSLIGAAGRALTGGGSSPGGGGGGGGSGGAGGGSDPFAGTPLANNSGAFNAYNAANGPTAADISNSTNGIGNIDVGTIDTGAMPTYLSAGGDDSGDTDWGDIFSDRRLKTNIRKLGTDETGLNVYSFSYVWDTAKLCAGYMADEVMRVFPHAVGKRNGYLTVNYGMVR